MGTSEIICAVLDPYGILGLSKDASASAIRTSYKRLALQYHPDKTRDESLKKENSKRFQEVQEAYEILSDPRKRAEYDEEREMEAQIQEHRRREKEMNEKAKRHHASKQRERDEDYRRREAERKQYEADRRAEKEYLSAKNREEEQLRAAEMAQKARRMQADAKQRAEEDESKREKDRDRSKRESREERKRKEAEHKRLQEEAELKAQELKAQAERLRSEEERRTRSSDKEKRDRDRRKNRELKKDSYATPTYGDMLDPEVPTPRERSDRGRGSTDCLRDPPLAVPRDNSRRRETSRNRGPARDNSRHRESISREPEHPHNREKERVRREFYESNPRRMSTEPLQESYLRTPPMKGYGSPPTHSQSYYGSSSYSPPPSPRLRSSMPAMTTSQSYSGKEKGRDRTRLDRPSASGRKHSEIPSYAREPSFIPVLSDDLDHATPGNRDSGYSTSSNTTPMKDGPRLSSERISSDTATPGKKYKWVMMPVSDDEGSSVSTSHTATPHRRPSRDDSNSHPHSNLRQGGSPPDAVDPDVFQYLTSGSKSFSYSPETHYSSSAPKASAGGTGINSHARHGSDHERPSAAKLGADEFTHAYVPASHKPRHHSSREVPPVGGASSGGGGSGYYPPPSFHRGATWSGS